MLKLRVAAVLIAFSFTSVMYGQNCSYDPTEHSTGTFDGCPQHGKGGDTILNKLKNRDHPPAEYKSYSVNDLISNLPQDLPTTRRIHWDAAESDDACKYEQEGATVIGYLLGIKQEGPEACNCRIPKDRDYHIWLVGNTTDKKDNSVVIEISPRLLGSHPNWNKSALQHLVKQKSKVRISGWLMWDEEHDDQVGKSRGTHWEIHPIHKIEVWSSGKWSEL